MHVITAPNVNNALAQGISYLLANGIEEPSRSGPVLVAPGPVTTVYENPGQHVLFSPTRDANPWHNMFEALWMLAGRNDVATNAAFNSGMAQYSDDTKTFHGAYGYRWRKHFGYDQLDAIVSELQRDPASRRAVLAMWDGGQNDVYTVDMNENCVVRTGNDCDGGDLAHAATGLDIPCNTHVYFDLRGGKLNMTICCRSNDIIWGAYGADCVCFSMLLIYFANRLQAPVGVYRQVSNNYHLYTEKFSREKLTQIAKESLEEEAFSPAYAPRLATEHALPGWHFILEEDIRALFLEIETWLDDPGIYPIGSPTWTTGYTSSWVADIAYPMFLAWVLHKRKQTLEAIAVCDDITALDWAKACREWLQRRVK
jgi:thymidylate synthase